MLNQDLNISGALRFEFTDRTDNTRYICNFIKEDTFDTGRQNFLWVSGKSGVGVSRLLQECTQSLNKSDNIIIYVSIEEDGGGSEALESLLSQLTKIKSYSIKNTFGELVKSNPLIDPAVLAIRTLTDPVVGAVINAVYSVGKSILLENGEEVPVHEILAEYISAVLRKTEKKVTIIFDHFHRGEAEFIDTIQIVTQRFLGEDKVRIIFATSDDCPKERLRASRMLMESFSLAPYRIKEFKEGQEACFSQALRFAFPDLADEDQRVREIFKICNKNIGELKNSLSIYFANRYYEQEISLNGFLEFLKTHKNGRKVLDKTRHVLIVSCLQVFQKPVEKQLLYECFNYIIFHSYNLQSEDRIGFEDDLLFLEKLEIVSTNSNAHVALINWNFPDPDLNVVQKVYTFFLDWISYHTEKKTISVEDRVVLARLAVKAKIPEESSTICFEQAIELYNSNESFEACNCISSLISSGMPFAAYNPAITIRLAYSLYELGRYKDAETLLNMVSYNDQESLQERMRYDFFFLRGKCKNLRGRLPEALADFQKAEECALCEDMVIAAKGMQQLVLVEIPGKKDAAKNLLDERLRLMTEKPQYSLTECMVIRSLVDFYNDDASNNVLKTALIQSKEYEDSFICAALEVAWGLQCLRANNISDAIEVYETALNRLGTVKPHEQSYVFNNLGTCEMLLGNYDTALYYFFDGRQVNRSPFVAKVLKTNIAICYSLMGRGEEARELCDELYSDYQAQYDSYSLTRIGMAICFIIIQEELTKIPGNPYSVIFEDCAKIAKNNTLKTVQLDRLEGYENKYRLHEKFPDPFIRKNTSYYTSAFQPWVTTLHHD